MANTQEKEVDEGGMRWLMERQRMEDNITKASITHKIWLSGHAEHSPFLHQLKHCRQIRKKDTLKPNHCDQVYWGIDKCIICCTLWNATFSVLIYDVIISSYDPVRMLEIWCVLLFAPLLSGVKSFRILLESISSIALYSFLQYESVVSHTDLNLKPLF